MEALEKWWNDPATQQWLIEKGTSLVVAVLILVVGLWLAKALANTLKKVLDKRGFDPTLSSFFRSLLHMTGIVIVVIAALDKFGIQTAQLAAILAAVGLAIGFALQGSLSNVAAGVMLMIFRPIRVGDLVSAGGETGKVAALELFTTVMVTPDGRRIIVPNSNITGGNITNYTVEGKMRVDMVFGIGYDDDIAAAKKVILDIMEADERVFSDPAPFVGVTSHGDNSVNLVAHPWCETANKWDLWFDMHEKVKLGFDAAGISIPYPQRDVHIHNAS